MTLVKPNGTAFCCGGIIIDAAGERSEQGRFRELQWMTSSRVIVASVAPIASVIISKLT